MKKLFPLVLCLLLPFLSISQSFSGVILEEETTVEIGDAIVVIEGTALAKKTNDVGEFSFFEIIPPGEHIVTVTKEGYETKYFIINVDNGKRIVTDKVELEVTKSEKKRRKKQTKELEKKAKKLAKEREDKIKDIRKDKEAEEKRLAKQKKKLSKKSKDVIVSYDPVETNTEPGVTKVSGISGIQIKYGNILGVQPESLIHVELYEFIDNWMGTTYLMGGATKDGIDCSSFSQRLYTSVYDLYIERTAQKQFDSKYTDRFKGKEFLKEGDLLFFKGVGESSDDISHVGVFLENNKFVHSTSRRDANGNKGVQISDITDNFWTGRFVAGGRRINNE